IPEYGITSIAFSEQNPSLLSVGLHDGTLAIFDIRKRDEQPVLMSKNHTGTIWDMQWINHGNEGEKLHSVSVDGRVNSWSIKKGLECREIMRLKRDARFSEHGNAIISRESGAMSID